MICVYSAHGVFIEGVLLLIRIRLMKLLIPVAVLFLNTIPVYSEFPTKQYDLGFEAVTVFDYKKTLRRTGKDIPKLPPRTESALIVKWVESDSRADLAGLKENDLIRIINGSYLRSPQAADEKLNLITDGDKLKLGVIRQLDGKWKQVSLTLKALSDSDALKLKLRTAPGFDRVFMPYSKIRHKNAPRTTFAPNNCQLYYTETFTQPEKLYLKIAQLIPGASQSGQFIITTETEKYMFEAEVVQTSNRKILSGSLRSPEAFAVQSEILLILSEASLKKLKEDFRSSEETYNREFKKFQFDKTRKNKADQERNQQRLKLIASMERINSKIMRVEKNHQTLLRRRDQREKPSIISGHKQIKLSEKTREAIRSHYANLTSEQKKLINRVTSYNMFIGLMKEEELLQLEEIALLDLEIQKRREKQGWKWIDLPLNRQQLEFVKKMIAAKKVTIHYGAAPQQKFDLTAEQQEQMKTILTAFNAAGGKEKK